MRVNIGNGTPSASSSSGHIPVPSAPTRKARKTSHSAEVIPGPATSITHPRGRSATPKRARVSAISISSSEREHVPTTIRGGSVAASSRKSSSSSARVPQMNTNPPAKVAAPSAFNRPLKKATPYVGAAASSSSAAAAADTPDVPTDQGRRGPIPSRIKNQEVLEELKKAKANGVLHGRGLDLYNVLDEKRQLLHDQGIFTISASRYKEYKKIYKDFVFGLKPPEAL